MSSKSLFKKIFVAIALAIILLPSLTMAADRFEYVGSIEVLDPEQNAHTSVVVYNQPYKVRIVTNNSIPIARLIRVEVWKQEKSTLGPSKQPYVAASLTKDVDDSSTNLIDAMNNNAFIISRENVEKTITIWAEFTYKTICASSDAGPVYCPEDTTVKTFSTDVKVSTAEVTNNNNSSGSGSTNNSVGSINVQNPTVSAVKFKSCKSYKSAGLGETISCYISNITAFLLWAAGILSVVMIIVSGVLFTTSGGNAKKVDSAKNALTAAVVGAVIVLLSYTISSFIVSSLGSSYQVTNPETINADNPNGSGGTTDELLNNLNKAIDQVN